MNTEQTIINALARIARRLAQSNQEGLDKGEYNAIKDYVRGKVDAYNFMANLIDEYVKEDVNND